MPMPPPEFPEEYEAFRSRLDWAGEGYFRDHDVVQAQLCYAEMQDFLVRWQGKTGHPELEEGLAACAPIVAALKKALRASYLEALADLVEKRHSVLLSPILFEGDLKILALHKQMPEHLRPEFERTVLGHDGVFDPEAFFRQAETDTEASETAYQQALAAMEITWPDHFTGADRTRLANARIEEINIWRGELAPYAKESPSEE